MAPARRHSQPRRSVVAAAAEGHSPKRIAAAIAGHSPERTVAAATGRNPRRIVAVATADRNPGRTTAAAVGQSQVGATLNRLQREEGPARSSLAGYCSSSCRRPAALALL